MDANGVLTLTCQRLKREAGKPPDFAYEDLAAVKEAQDGEVTTRPPILPPAKRHVVAVDAIAFCMTV